MDMHVCVSEIHWWLVAWSFCASMHIRKCWIDCLWNLKRGNFSSIEPGWMMLVKRGSLNASSWDVRIIATHSASASMFHVYSATKNGFEANVCSTNTDRHWIWAQKIQMWALPFIWSSTPKPPWILSFSTERITCWYWTSWLWCIFSICSLSAWEEKRKLEVRLNSIIWAPKKR